LALTFAVNVLVEPLVFAPVANDALYTPGVAVAFKAKFAYSTPFLKIGAMTLVIVTPEFGSLTFAVTVIVPPVAATDPGPIFALVIASGVPDA
jgi:hypothetical protein